MSRIRCTPAAILVLGLILCAHCSRPPLKVYTRGEVAYIDVRRHGEYVSDISRLQLRDESGIVWEVRVEGDGGQFGLVKLVPGDNPSAFEDAYYGSYRTIHPSSSDVFRVEPDRRYTVLVWASSPWPVEATFIIRSLPGESGGDDATNAMLEGSNPIGATVTTTRRRPTAKRERGSDVRNLSS